MAKTAGPVTNARTASAYGHARINAAGETKGVPATVTRPADSMMTASASTGRRLPLAVPDKDAKTASA